MSSCWPGWRWPPPSPWPSGPPWGPVSHAGRFADRLQQGLADAAGVVVDQLARNLRLLANSPFAWVGPIQVLLAGLIALRLPPPLRDLPDWTRRVLGLGAFGSSLLILLNDTGVTATAGSGSCSPSPPGPGSTSTVRPASPPASCGPGRRRRATEAVAAQARRCASRRFAGPAEGDGQELDGADGDQGAADAAPGHWGGQGRADRRTRPA